MQKSKLQFNRLSSLRAFELKSFRAASGFGIIEILVAVAVISIALFSIQQVSFLYLKQNIENKKFLKASYLAEEALEAARSVRDQGWTANIAPLTSGAQYYPVISSNKWTLSATNPGTIENIYTRQVKIENASRDTNDNIVTSGGTNDPNTKKATATVLWNGKSITLTTYITNIYNN